MGLSYSQKKGSSAFKILTGNPTGNRPLGRPRRRWEGNIIMDLEEIGVNMRNWVDRNYRRAFVNATLNLRVSQAMYLASDCTHILY